MGYYTRLLLSHCFYQYFQLPIYCDLKQMSLWNFSTLIWYNQYLIVITAIILIIICNPVYEMIGVMNSMQAISIADNRGFIDIENSQR